MAVFVLYRAPEAASQAKTAASARLSAMEWRLVICAAAAWGVFNAAYVTYLTFGPKVLEAEGLSGVAAAGVISIGSWLMIGSGALCGQFVDRFGRREMVLTVCMTGAVLALWMLSLPGRGIAASLLRSLTAWA